MSNHFGFAVYVGRFNLPASFRLSTATNMFCKSCAADVMNQELPEKRRLCCRQLSVWSATRYRFR